MSNLKRMIDTFLEEGQNLIEARIEMIRLESLEKSIGLISAVITWSIIVLIGMIFMVVGTLTVGFLLSEEFGSYSVGFGMLTGFYFLLLIVLFLLRKKILRKGIEEKIYGYFVDAKIKNLEDDK